MENLPCLLRHLFGRREIAFPSFIQWQVWEISVAAIDLLRDGGPVDREIQGETYLRVVEGWCIDPHCQRLTRIVGVFDDFDFISDRCQRFELVPANIRHDIDLASAEGG